MLVVGELGTKDAVCGEFYAKGKIQPCGCAAAAPAESPGSIPAAIIKT